MIALAYYLLKVVLCSGLLAGYYFLALRNRLFHQWNRFYLLAAVLLSLLVPLMEFRFLQTEEAALPAIEMVGVVQNADIVVERWSAYNGWHISWQTASLAIYALVCTLFLAALIRSVAAVYQLRKQHPFQRVHNIRFYLTRQVKGTPFSFFRSIFWNADIDLQSVEGQKIFDHEMVHVQEKHSVDKLLMQCLLSLFWINPFFWLIRRELAAIHEFLADRKAIRNGDTSVLAAMILQASYPQQYSLLTQSFFTSSIKRRILMLTKMQNPKISYAGRIAALPLLALLIMAFTFKTEKIKPLAQSLTVVIDAGHGKMSNGQYSGAVIENIPEDEINLTIARQIAALNKNPQIKIVLTRADENIVGLQKRVELAANAGADLFISLHVNAKPENDKASGIEVIASQRNETTRAQSLLLASSLISELNGVYQTLPTAKFAANGVYVLDRNPLPAVLIECGYITNAADRQFITATANQEAIAKNILEAIERYANQKQTPVNHVSLQKDTLPEKPVVVTFGDGVKTKDGKTIKQIDVNKPKDKITIMYTDGSAETMTEQEALLRNIVNVQAVKELKPQPNPAPVIVRGVGTDAALYIFNGKEISKEMVAQIDPATIQSVDVLKNDAAVAMYGEKARAGVIIIKTKEPGSNEKTNPSINLSQSAEVVVIGYPKTKIQAGSKDEVVVEARGIRNNTEPVFEQSDAAPSINSQLWLNFVTPRLEKIVDDMAAKGVKPGTYTFKLKFIVEKDGSLNNISVITDQYSEFHTSLVHSLKGSPRWNPAIQNGFPVRAWHVQPVILVISPDDSKTTITIGQIQTLAPEKLFGLQKGDKLTSAILSTDLDNGDIIAVNIQENQWPNGSKSVLAELKPGKTLYIDNILVLHNGEMQKRPSKVYRF